LRLARLAFHLRAQGWPPLTLTVVDGDLVERKNVGRQWFAPHEVGQPKAQVLADRLNAAFGLEIVAVPAMATARLLTDIQPPSHALGLLVGAVDTASERTSSTRSTPGTRVGKAAQMAGLCSKCIVVLLLRFPAPRRVAPSKRKA